MNLLRKQMVNKEFIFLNGFLLLFLFLVMYFSPFRPTSELLLFSPDSLTYFHTGGEFFHLSETGDSIIRPFFYSSFLRLFYELGGAWLVVILQSLFWVISANLIFYGVKSVSNRLFVRLIAIALFVANISLITYIFHGLTELMTVLLLAIAVYLTCKTFKNGADVKYWLKMVLIFCLLTVVKPLFQYPALFILLVGLIRYHKELWRDKKLIAYVFLAVTPLLLQLFVMNYKYGITRVSTIDKLTYDTYFIAQGIREIKGIEDVAESQHMAQTMTQEEKRAFLMENKQLYFKLFIYNVERNASGDGSHFITPPGYNTQSYLSYMHRFNNKLYTISKAFLLLFMAISFIDLLTWKWFRYWQQLAIGLLLYYIVFASGISYWQGDRLVIFSIPLWITLYILLSYRVVNANFANKPFSKKKVKQA